MKIFKTMVFFPDVPDGNVYKCDTFWLVPEWLESLATGTRKPLRIVRLDLFQHQNNLKVENRIADFVLTQGIPKAVFDGQIRTLAGIEVVIEMPPIEVPIPPAVH